MSELDANFFPSNPRSDYLSIEIHNPLIKINNIEHPERNLRHHLEGVSRHLNPASHITETILLRVLSLWNITKDSAALTRAINALKMKKQPNINIPNIFKFGF